MTRKSIFILLFSFFLAFVSATPAESAHTDHRNTGSELQDKHNKFITLRMQHIKQTVELTVEEENKLNAALVTLDKSRLHIWKQSHRIRKELENQKSLTDDEATAQLEKLLDLDRELQATHLSFYKSLADIGFTPRQRLHIYISLKDFHSKMGRSIRD